MFPQYWMNLAAAYATGAAALAFDAAGPGIASAIAAGSGSFAMSASAAGGAVATGEGMVAVQIVCAATGASTSESLGLCDFDFFALPLAASIGDVFFTFTDAGLTQAISRGVLAVLSEDEK